MKPTIHMVANAHIDPVWLWVWQDGLEVAQSTCRDAVDLMDRYPDYVFSRSSAAVYRWLELTDPEIFAQIKRLVSEGRWNIVNGWWVQPDCNIPCGESLVRQGLYGQLYFKERFGRTAKVGFNVDTFGHCGTLPQILRKCGLDSYVFHRPGIYEKSLPSDLFLWQSPDGSRVVASRIEGYGAGDVKHLEEKVGRSLAYCRDTGHDALCLYGKGDHGGGPHEVQMTKIGERSRSTVDVSIAFSTPDSFFEAISALSPELPVVEDDLQHHSRGCYTVVSEIKALNRRLEVSLLNAEKFCTMANLIVGMEYPRARLRQAWETLLFHQFHDVLSGTSIEPAYNDARDALTTAMKLSDSERDMALETISARIGTRGPDGQQLLVFNPAHCEREDPIEFQATLPEAHDLVALDDEGVEHPIQVLSSDDFEGKKKVSGVFLAKLPSLGYRVFWIRKGLPAGTDIKSSESSIENSHLRVSIDPATGRLASIVDKGTGIEFLADMCRPIVVEDRSDTWSHDVVQFRDEIGSFEPSESPVIQAGPVRASVTVKGEYGQSTLIQTFILHSNHPLIECRIDLDWQERHKMLKLSYPTTVRSPRATYEIPYGTIERPTNGEEEPGQRWIDLSGTSKDGGSMGLLLLNESKYGFDVLDSEMRISLVRSPIYAFHSPREPDPDREYVYTDQGRHAIRVALLPHLGAGTGAMFSHAERLNNLPIVAFSNPHDGELPSSSSLLIAKPDNIAVGALKVSEESDRIVLRLFESGGEKTRSTVEFPLSKLKFATDLGPWEIKTLTLTKEGDVQETNMLEAL
jgi:alpha-mannosidase